MRPGLGILKHVELKYHFVRDKVKSGEIKLVYVPTEENVADIMTKCLARIKFERFRDRLVHDIEGNQIALRVREQWWYPYRH